MKIENIDPSEASPLFMDKNAVVVCQDQEGNNNLITIAWKSIGQLWSKPIITIAIKTSRYSHEVIENGLKEFTINFGGKVKEIDMFCGTNSGRNTDKAKETNTNLIPCKGLRVPMIEGAKYSYGCKIIHQTGSGNITDHTLYYGEIKTAFRQQKE